MRYFLNISPDKRPRLACVVVLALLSLVPVVLPQNGGGTLGKVDVKKRPPYSGPNITR
jgi:hypothetical protein